MESVKEAGESKMMAGIDSLNSEIVSLREKCLKVRHLMDEGTHKLNSSLNVLNKLKSQEQNIINSADNPVAVKQMSEEQIDGLLEMLKTPAFQNLLKQMMLKYLTQDSS